ncbi:hypothetical protein [Natrarchaeobaculum sulfurireducens]|uniref:hypothetical protein n=1 Tax=Natrarchaeobaculum sulfurireducens TaxID=2044521 RepID=UPI00105AB0BA|nr:hypothetical protein [Natrarchaeobaculum sulfurireducens]
MSDFKQRRRFLQLAGTGVAASIAGCSDLSVSDDGDGNGADGQLTALVEPDMDELQQLQEDVMAGDVSEEEAQQQQQELFESAIDDFQSRVDAESDDDLRVEEGEDDAGLYLVDGSGEVLVDALRSGEISVLGGGSLYEQLLEQQQQQPAPEGGEEIDEEELEEIEDQLQEEAEEGEAPEEGDESEDD